MRIVVSALLLMLAAACGSTSYGAATNGVFPSRPSGAAYPNWEHMCLSVTESGTSDKLNDAGDKGWELVSIGLHKGETLMCFKREKPT